MKCSLPIFDTLEIIGNDEDEACSVSLELTYALLSDKSNTIPSPTENIIVLKIEMRERCYRLESNNSALTTLHICRAVMLRIWISSHFADFSCFLIISFQISDTRNVGTKWLNIKTIMHEKLWSGTFVCICGRRNTSDSEVTTWFGKSSNSKSSYKQRSSALVFNATFP